MVAASTTLAIPWWGIVAIDGPLPLFGVAFALESKSVLEIRHRLQDLL